MLALASFVMRSRSSAIMASSVTALLSLVVMPLCCISAAVLALVTLRKGIQEGLVIFVGATAAIMALCMLILGSVSPTAGFIVGLWLPILLLASTLRYTTSMAMTIELAVFFGTMLVLTLYISLGEPVLIWQEILQKLFKIALQEPGIQLDAAKTAQLIASVAQSMTGMVGAVVAAIFIISILIARWWQAHLFNPGGFRLEFIDLRMHRWFALILLVIGIAAVLSTGTMHAFIADIFRVCVLGYMFQGLSLIHKMVAIFKVNIVWLVVTYVLLTLALPQMAVLLVVLGYSDAWLNFRRKVPDRFKPL